MRIDEILQDKVRRILARDSALAMVCEKALKRVRLEKPYSAFYELRTEGRLTDRILWDITGQRHYGTNTLEHAYCFVQIKESLLGQRLAITPVGVPGVPGVDADTGYNNAILSEFCRSSGSLFRAEFRGGPGDNDGYFEWTQPIESVTHDGDRDFKVTIGPFRAPLEVGNTSPHTTLRHLGLERAVARWPYGYSVVFIMFAIRQVYAAPGDSGDEGSVAGTPLFHASIGLSARCPTSIQTGSGTRSGTPALGLADPSPRSEVGLIASVFTGADQQCYDERVMVTNVVATITALEAQAAASLFLSDNLGDRFLASSPKLDSAAHVWRVPILLAYPFIGPVGQTGEILVNATSEEIISYTPLEEMKATARRLYEENRDAIEAAFLQPRNP